MNPAHIQMDVASLLDYYSGCGIHLHVKDGELGWRASKGAMTEDHLSAIRTRKRDILRHLTSLEKSRFHIAAATVNRAPLFNRFLWKDYSNRIMEAGSANVTHIVKRCTGELLTDSLLRSIDILLERHDVLNSSIDMDDGNLYLVCHARKSAAFREVFVTGKTAGEREAEAYRLANNLVWEEYDLADGPLYRVFLIRISALEYILGVAIHHAIGDLISIGILFQELFSIYGSVMADIPLRLPQNRVRYMDYLASMETWSASSVCMEYVQYWKDKLKSAPVTDLIPDENRHRATTVSESTAETKFQLDTEVSRNLKKIAVHYKTTQFTILLAIYKITIWRMTGYEEPVVVALNAGRLDAGLQNTIGDFAQEVAYKTRLSGNPDFEEVIGRVIRTINEANLHQPVPLDWVRLALANEGILFCAPGMNFISADAGHAQNPWELRQLTFTPPGVRHGCHGFPVSFSMEFRDIGNVIENSTVYRNDLYDELTIQAFLNCFIQATLGFIRSLEKKFTARKERG